MVKPFPTMLAQPAQRALKGAGISKIEDLTRFTEKEISDLHGMGPNAMQKLKEVMLLEDVSFSAPTE